MDSKNNNIKPIPSFYIRLWYIKEDIKKKFFFKLKKYRTLWYCVKTYSQKPLIFEIHGADHCNLNCSGCTHYSPLAKEHFCDPIQLKEDLKYLKRFGSRFSKINILGGEPLLNPGITEILQITREAFPNNRINLVSNGILILKPEKLPFNFWETVRQYQIVIRVTKYPIGIDYNEIADICESNGVKFEITKDCIDTDRWRNGQLDLEGHGKKTTPIISRHFYCYLRDNIQLVDGKLYPCAQIAHVKHLNRAFGKNFAITKRDYLEVSKIKYFWQIRNLAIWGTPFCKYCRGETKYGGWSKTKHTTQEWTK